MLLLRTGSVHYKLGRRFAEKNSALISLSRGSAYRRKGAAYAGFQDGDISHGMPVYEFYQSVREAEYHTAGGIAAYPVS